MTISAIILSGGRSSRFGGVHKPAVELGEATVISRILGGVRTLDPSAEVWVAGSVEGLSAEEAGSVHHVREEPEFAGPLAGIAAAGDGMRAASTATEAASETLVLAGDIPLITPGHLRELVDACRGAGLPATSSDGQGKTQFLCAAWPCELLLSLLAEVGDPVDAAVRHLYAGVETIRVDVAPGIIADFDTAEEFDRIRTRFDSEL
ncbi:molybdenum cofactor guanylyltransferase [Brevibacterium sp.]|uniref:molybdenum cofactor guanylyltransferase n=1 Tax=Brevibacterium sp. TaxID=1701 RepID=UPI002649510B|nr:NTP transferase domain-containing protein [Brevibacterium sp.]MDN5833606.1 NTP transferase domain-containing protein [Brevibacterium sp.]MDN6604099.1 NTP transferase domain-containing protein [Brevibacterium sp.]